MKKVSIVMPLYNVEHCMERAIQSIFNQDYDNWELVLVDDGSPDKSGEIADRIQSEFPKKVISLHGENKGQGGARNKGVEYASGDYLIFVDSDDEIEPNLLSFCVERMEKEKAQVLVFEYSMLNPNGEVVKTAKNPFNFSENKNLREDNSYLMLQGMACNKMFSLPFYKASGITFAEKVRYEDLLLSTEMLFKADKIIYSSKPLYRYYLSQNSAMRNTDIDRNRELFWIMDQMFEYFRENDAFDEYLQELCYLTIDNVYVASSLRLIRIDSKHKMIKEFHNYLKTHFPNYRKNKYIGSLSPQYKLTFWLLEHRLYCAIRWLTSLKDRATNRK